MGSNDSLETMEMLTFDVSSFNLKKMGNIDLSNSFLALHYELYDFYVNELSDDPRAFEYENILKDIKKQFKTGEELNQLYYDLFVEAKKRGLKDDFISREIIYTDSFEEWRIRMLNTPTYISEVHATNYPGGCSMDYADDDYNIFDYPVKEAIKILNNKGYISYWSSANYTDALFREGHAVLDKHVAYILLDPKNLTDELKDKLRLNGKCDFWGIALKYADNGSYYGIWTEISSSALCSDISNALASKAFALPELDNIKKLK